MVSLGETLRYRNLGVAGSPVFSTAEEADCGAAVNQRLIVRIMLPLSATSKSGR